MNTTTIVVNGKNYTIPNDKVQHIVSMLEAYNLNQKPAHESYQVLSNQPSFDGRSLING
jgi:hypothetical protein